MTTTSATVRPLPGSRSGEPVVVICEDIRSYRISLARLLERECGIASLGVADYNHAILALEEHPSLMVVVSDYDLGPGEPTGLELLIDVGWRWPAKGRLLISGLTTGDLVALAYARGIPCIDKDLPEEILKTVCAMAKP